MSADPGHDRAHLDEIWARYQTGDELAERDLDTLRATCETDPALLDDLAEDFVMEGLLRTAGQISQDPQPFTQRVKARLAAEKDAPGYVNRVARRLSDERRIVRPRRRLIWGASAACAMVALIVALGVAKRTREENDSSLGRGRSVLTQNVPQTQPVSGAARLSVPVPGAPASPRTILRNEETPVGLAIVGKPIRFDFEGLPVGRAPGWKWGQVTRCPPKPSSARCLAAERHTPNYPNQVGVSVGTDNRPLLTFNEDVYLEFDYWLGDSTSTRKPQLEIMVFGQNHEPGLIIDHVFDAGPSVTWNRVRVPLALAGSKQGRGLVGGTPVVRVQILLLWSENDVLFVDDVEFVQYGRR